MVHWATSGVVTITPACSASAIRSVSFQVFSSATSPVMEISHVSNISWSSGLPSAVLSKRMMS